MASRTSGHCGDTTMLTFVARSVRPNLRQEFETGRGFTIPCNAVRRSPACSAASRSDGALLRSALTWAQQVIG